MTRRSSRLLPNWDGSCLRCGLFPPKVNFQRGPAGVCDRCSLQVALEKNPFKARARRLLHNARVRSKKLGWPEPEITLEWVESRLRAGKCEATGIEFDFSIRHDRKSYSGSPRTPSLDRKDSEKPYTTDNTQVVVVIYNLCKADYEHSDVVSFCKAVVQRELDTV